MAISILPPAPADTITENEADLEDIDGDVHMGEDDAPSYLPKLSGKHIVTPGESITGDPQWMRYVCSSPPLARSS